ncbi:MAG: DNA alkylation repair protein [Leptonema sp. (in: bacteria)]
MDKIKKICEEIDSYAKEDKALFFRKYFKFYTFPKMKYKESDIFKGIPVPSLRKIAKKHYNDLTMQELSFFLRSRVHEYRFFALLILILQFQRIEKYEKKHKYQKLKRIVTYYLKNVDYLNNWNLVDISAPNILGKFLFLYPKEKVILHKLSQSKHLWKERISILATYYLIKHYKFDETFLLAEKFFRNPHDLIQKATGWMLREIGKRDKNKLLLFLKKHYTIMPRTMFRYATEKLNPEEKESFEIATRGFEPRTRGL